MSVTTASRRLGAVSAAIWTLGRPGSQKSPTRIALTPFSAPRWCPDTLPMNAARRPAVSLLRALQSRRWPMLWAAHAPAAPPWSPTIISALAMRLVHVPPAAQRARGGLGAGNGIPPPWELRVRQDQQRKLIHISTTYEPPPSRSPLVFRRRLRLDSFVRHGLATVRFLVEAIGGGNPASRSYRRRTPFQAVRRVVAVDQGRQIVERFTAVADLSGHGVVVLEVLQQRPRLLQSLRERRVGRKRRCCATYRTGRASLDQFGRPGMRRDRSAARHQPSPARSRHIRSCNSSGEASSPRRQAVTKARHVGHAHRVVPALDRRRADHVEALFPTV